MLSCILAQAALRAAPEVPFAMRSWPLLIPTFSPSFYLSVFCFWPTSGKLPRLNICFPQYYNFYCFTKKGYIWVFFLLLTASIRSRLPGPPLVLGVFWHVSEAKYAIHIFDNEYLFHFVFWFFDQTKLCLIIKLLFFHRNTSRHSIRDNFMYDSRFSIYLI